MTRQETFRTQKEHGRRMKILKKICAKFMDILPFQPRATSSRSNECTIVYDGPHPPQTRLEELAFDIQHVMIGTDTVGKRMP